MNAGSEIGQTGRGRAHLIAAVLALAWFALLAIGLHAVVIAYFPYADQWSLIAHSHPAFAEPVEWITRGFRDYFVADPGAPAPTSDVFRPIFNLGFWLLGLLLSPVSGGYLYLNYAAIACCAGLGYLAIAQTPEPERSKSGAVLAAAIPLLPALLPSLSILFVPVLAFDALAACFCLLAYIAVVRGRYVWAMLTLLLAVFTKETALPVTVAVPALYALNNWRALGRRDVLGRMALLFLPLLLWCAARLLVFQGLTSGNYVLAPGAAAQLRQILKLALRWPLWFDALPFRDPQAGTFANISSLLVLIANLASMSLVLSIAWLRLRSRQWPRLAESAFALSYAFMLLVGQDPRYGAVLDVFLAVSLAMWLGEVGLRRRVLAIAAVLGIGVLIGDFRALQAYPRRAADAERIFGVARDYAELLRGLPRDTRVLVLNDPATLNSTTKSLRRVLGLDTDVEKLADFLCPNTIERLAAPCQASLRTLPEPRQFEFSQTCGIDLCGATAAVNQPARLPVAGVSLEMIPAPDAAGADVRWRSMRFTLDRGGVQLLYFDPADDSFHRLPVP